LISARCRRRQELRLVDRRQFDVEAPVEVQAVNGVELLEQADDILLLVEGGLAPGLPSFITGARSENTGIPVRLQSRGDPDELDVLVAEAGGIFDADAHVNVEDLGGFKESAANRGSMKL
jgi:hypothetical protein